MLEKLDTVLTGAGVALISNKWLSAYIYIGTCASSPAWHRIMKNSYSCDVKYILEDVHISSMLYCCALFSSTGNYNQSHLSSCRINNWITSCSVLWVQYLWSFFRGKHWGLLCCLADAGRGASQVLGWGVGSLFVLESSGKGHTYALLSNQCYHPSQAHTNLPPQSFKTYFEYNWGDQHLATL